MINVYQMVNNNVAHEEETVSIYISYHSFSEWSVSEIKMKWGRGEEMNTGYLSDAFASFIL